MSSKTTTISDWLLEAKHLQPGDDLNIYLRGDQPPPSFQDMRAALYAQYGADTLIRIWKHGHRICVFIHAVDDERQQFDRCNARYVTQDKGRKRIEIENGFVKELPSVSGSSGS